MADDQAKFDVKIGLQVEGGDSAAKSIAALTRQISGLEKDSAKLRSFANAIGGVFGTQKEAYQAAARLKSQREQAAALKPVIESVRSALKGMPPELASALGIDAKSISAAGKSVAAFDSFAKKLNSARTRLVESAGDALAKQSELTGQRTALINESRAVQRIQERVAKAAVEAGKATEQQKVQVALEGAQKRIAVAKQAAVATSQVELNAARQRLGGTLRAVLRQASQDPMGGAQRPTLRELQGRSVLPMADRRLIGGTAPTTSAPASSAAAERSISGLAAAANEAAAALRALPKSMATTATASQRELANLHKQMRVAEATTYPRGAYAQRSAGGGGPVSPPSGVAPAYNQIAQAADGAGRSIAGVRREQDAIIGQVKNVVGMAFGYQALQAIAGELNQVFGHLKSGIVQFNSMIESTTVGFTTLFENQAKQAYAAAESMDENRIKIDFLQMGYSNAQDAAAGMIETIREFANVTPFRFAELQESALRMRAFGFELDEVLRKNPETKEFEGGIVAVGNAVSALGGGADAFRRITYALGQMKQAGRVYQNDMMQLANAGIGGYRYIADALQREITTDNSGSREKVKAGYQQLFNDLESNAIETVRRLTTNGQISGEAASRAILSGLEEDFGGGMEKQAKTFVGAFSTVADMSQSLVADAFKPLYDSIRDTTVEFANFLQQATVRGAFETFSETVQDVVDGFEGIGDTVTDIATRSFNDLTRAIDNVSNKATGLGNVFQNTFGSLSSGIAAIGELLRNDYSRALVVAGIATKALLAFGTSNPFLSQIILIISTLGILKQAVDNNTLGIGDSFRALQDAAEPFVAVLRDELIPVFGEIANSFLSTVVATLVAGLRAIEPAVTLILKVLTKVFEVIAEFKGPIAAFGVVLAGAFIGGKVINGFKALSAMITELLFKFEQLAIKARLARVAMDAPKGKRTAYEYKTREVYDKKTGQMVQQQYFTGRYRYENTPKTPVSPREGGQIPMAAAAGGLRGIVGGMDKTAFVGMAAILTSQLAAMAGLPTEIADVATNIGSSLLMFGMLKTMVPPGTFSAIKTGLLEMFKAIQKYAMMGLAGLASKLRSLASSIKSLAIAQSVSAGLTRLQKALMGFTLISTLVGSVTAGLTALGSALAAVAVPIGALLAAVAAAFGLSELAKGAEAEGVKGDAARVGMDITDEEAKRIGRVGRLFGFGYDRETVLKMTSKEDLALFDEYFKKTRELFTLTEREDAMIAFREGERAASGLANAAGDTGDKFTTVNEQMKLLVAKQEQAANAQERLNGLLAIAQRNLSGATDLLEELASSVLDDILNPETRVNPYTGLEQLGLTLEEQLDIEKELGFTEFENAQGRARSFAEYKDLLDSIKPLTEDEVASGEINLKMVKERLKIETERRKEQERIKALAEAEYDIGLATLQQYDESIDPLQRAVNLRNAQKKYTQDIANLQFEGLQGIVSEAEASDAFARATAATQKRLKDLKKGQELILQEMKRMFTDYNNDIADIMANPNLTAAQKKNAVNERLAQLKSELESNFGITEQMITDKIGEFNGAMDSVLDVLNLEGQNLTVSWGQGLVAGLEEGGFGVLRKYMESQLAKVINLAARIKAAANVSDELGAGAGSTAAALAAKLTTRLNAAISAGKFGPTAQINIRREIARLTQLTDLEAIVNKFNTISGILQKVGFASGGIMPANQLALVGERGPELVLPQSRGLVLNNSISSRLMSMMHGGGSGGASKNVTINVNNPVIRSENDIRKLAQEISRAQASQFRTEGGRLY